MRWWCKQRTGTLQCWEVSEMRRNQRRRMRSRGWGRRQTKGRSCCPGGQWRKRLKKECQMLLIGWDKDWESSLDMVTLAGTVSMEWWEWKLEYGGSRKDGKRGPGGGRISPIYLLFRCNEEQEYGCSGKSRMTSRSSQGYFLWCVQLDHIRRLSEMIW